MAGIMTRTQFTDLFGTTMLPAIDAVIFGKFNKRPDEYVKYFNVKETDRSIEQTTQVSGLGVFVNVGEGQNTRYDSPIQGFDKTYTPTDWTLGFKTTHRAMADDKFGIVQKLASELGRSARETIEIEAANVYNRAFNSSYTGPDGKVLCATDHPLLGGGTQRNRPSVQVDLDIPSLEAGLTDFRNQVDSRNKKVRLSPTRLVVPSALEFAATEILYSQLRSDNANNAINAFKNRDGEPTLTRSVYDYLTDTDAWFILADSSDLEVRFYWREKFDTMHDTDFDSRSLKTAGWMTFDVGFSQYDGVWGSAGA